MLKSLQIRNYVLIDSLDVNFPEGLIIITGQTGAGKSILLGALSLLMGSKADAAAIALDADNCVVEAVFGVPQDDLELRSILDENEIDLDGDEMIVRRVVNRSGRSRSFVNDSPVTLPILQSISSRLVDIHSQHQTLLLTDHSFQLSMLDHFAGNADLLSNCASSYHALSSLEKEYSELSSRLERLKEEREYTQARYQRLEDAHLQDGELESLELELKQLANAEDIKEGLCSVENLFNPSDLDSESMSLSGILKEAQKHLEKVGKYIPDATELSLRIASSRAELEDILSEVSSIGSRVEVSPDRLQAVEDRLSLLYDLLKKYSAANIAELISQRDSLADALFDSDSLEGRLNELQKAIFAQQKSLDDICDRLHVRRAKAAGPFAEAICKSVRSLELDHAVFKVDINAAPASASGTDSVSFLFSAVGSNPVDVAKCASGGEMSRLMLCLKAMMARFVAMPTLIFDEIDTGVSGSVADKMGQMICEMGKDMQVFAITHLPQVAAKGAAHYLVEKEYDVLGTKATSSIRALIGDERVREIARMLSGSTITEAAMENAKELLR